MDKYDDIIMEYYQGDCGFKYPPRPKVSGMSHHRWKKKCNKILSKHPTWNLKF